MRTFLDTRAGKALAFLVLLGLPLAAMEWIVWKVSGWQPVLLGLGTAVAGGFGIWLFARRLPSRGEVAEQRLRAQGWTPPPDAPPDS